MTQPPSLSLLRLFHLVSPALPVGAYHFSQGLEYAVHADWVRDEAGALDWIAGMAENAIGTLDLPLLLRMHRAWNHDEDIAPFSAYLLAARETAELRTEERHMGKALAKVLVELEIDAAREWLTNDVTTYAAMFALAASHWSIDASTTAQAYVWAWAENQVLSALKLLPLGQSAGQRILHRLILRIPHIVMRAQSFDIDDIGIATPLQAMASAWHETQYSRLFRS